MAVIPDRRYTADEKRQLLDIILQAQSHCRQRPLRDILSDLGLAAATYYRWSARASQGQLTDDVVVPKRVAVPPTPVEVTVEVTTVREFALAEPPMGYKRLTYALMLENKAFLRPWMVRDVLSQASLLGRRPPPPAALRRPPDADHPISAGTRTCRCGISRVSGFGWWMCSTPTVAI